MAGVVDRQDQAERVAILEHGVAVQEASGARARPAVAPERLEARAGSLAEPGLDRGAYGGVHPVFLDGARLLAPGRSSGSEQAREHEPEEDGRRATKRTPAARAHGRRGPGRCGRRSGHTRIVAAGRLPWLGKPPRSLTVRSRTILASLRTQAARRFG